MITVRILTIKKVLTNTKILSIPIKPLSTRRKYIFNWLCEIIDMKNIQKYKSNSDIKIIPKII